MFLIGVILVAIALLFLLTALALTVGHRRGHPLRTAATLAAIFTVGLVLLSE